MRSPIIVALDYPTLEQALACARQLDPAVVRVKVGKQLFTSVGPAVLAQLHDLGFDVFLDLKFHDIPNTVAGAVGAAADLGVWMVNVHASGGRRMMEAAVDAVAKRGNKTQLIAVTVLTSMDQSDLTELGIKESPADRVMRLATLAKSSGMDGIVCSAQEATLLSRQFGRDFSLVTPGIRLPEDEAGDQRRVVTPWDAIDGGSTHLVMGRSITGSSSPTAVVEKIVARLESSNSP
jgi:orotidine-5'-phosphate decarboxylase